MKLQNKTTRTLLLAISILAIAQPGYAQSKETTPASPAPSSATDLKKSCHQFVQSFYTWYLSKAVSCNSDIALKKKKSAFSAELYKRLEEDRAVAAKTPDEVVGLDFDPFTNSQDPSDKYVVGTIVPKGDKYLVDVYGIREGKKSPKPEVVPELAYKNGQWQFVNFHYGKSEYPQNENLLSVLKALKTDREKTAK